jgi:hypothetical protein
MGSLREPRRAQSVHQGKNGWRPTQGTKEGEEERLVCASCGALLPIPGAPCQVCGGSFERLRVRQLRTGVALMLLAVCIAIGIAVVFVVLS